MYIFLGTIILILLFISIYEHQKFQLQASELSYITDKIEQLITEDSSQHILVPSENKAVKHIVSSVNRLLDRYYQQRMEYHRSQKSMSVVLTNVSHDLKTPLTVLKGYTEMLYLKTEHGAMNKDIENLIDKLDNKTSEIVHMVNQFFNMAKLESGDTVLNIQNVNISQICRETMLEYYDLLEEQKYDIAIQISDKPIYACADEDALSRILKNLIDNAIKYGGDGKYLSISVREIENKVFIDIEDHGKGICEEEKEQIFSRSYFSREKRFRRNNQSNGLGLTISQNLARQMKGEIRVFCCNESQTIFTLDLIKS